MVKSFFHLFLVLSLFILGACASKMKDQMKAYRELYATGDTVKAFELLEKSDLKDDEKSKLLWHLEKGTAFLSLGDENVAIEEFQTAIDLIDELYTKKISAKAASFLINDSSDVFYGANYERSYAYYFLAKAYYARFQKTRNKQDLQGARGTILAWDSYFAALQRSAAPKTIYQTDLMLKVFGAQIHEVSEIRNDKQIALQLYKDALNILDTMGGVFSVFNTKNVDYIKSYETALGNGGRPNHDSYITTKAKDELNQFLIYKILSLTREIRPVDYTLEVKKLAPSAEILAQVTGPKPNVVVVLEEGLIPQKVAKTFNIGLKGAVDSVESSSAKAFIATVGAEVLAYFAMNTLGLSPTSFDSAGSFMFAHKATQMAVQEVGISFELPIIEETTLLSDFDLVITDDQGQIVKRGPMAIISENGDIARVVLEEDAVSRYVKTGTRVAVKHILAIVAAMQVYQQLKSKGEFLAKAAAVATYVASSKGIGAMEKADTRHWTTIPKAFRMSELHLNPGTYQVGILAKASPVDTKSKVLGQLNISEGTKSIHTFRLINP